jgi:N utilization substance protein B
MGPRRRARELALQALYELDLNPGRTAPQAIANVLSALAAPEDDPEVRAFAERLVVGAAAARAQIDERLRAASANWRLERMAAVDRNLLRLGAHELLHEPEIPATVSIDEAVEIAKRFGTVDSPAFVHGILDRIAAELPKKP